MERYINEENNWDHYVEGYEVDVPVVGVSQNEVLQALPEIKTGKVPTLSEISLELIAASWGV